MWNVIFKIVGFFVPLALAFFGGLSNKIGWELSLVLAFFAGLIGLILIITLIWVFYKFKKAKEVGAIREKGEEERKLEDKRYALEKQKQEDLMINARVSEILPRFLNGEKLNPIEIAFANCYSPLLSNLIAKQYNLSGEAEDVIIEILKEFKPNRVKVNALFNKLIKKMKSEKVCSLQLVQFLNSITDADLDLIKEYFSYVAIAQETERRYGILFSFTGGEKLIKDVNLEFPQMWSNLNERGLKNGSIPIKLPPLEVVNILFKSHFSLQLTNLNKKEAEDIVMFCTLSKIGLELYNILEDEIQTSLDYIKDLAEYINKNPYSSIKAEIVDVKNNPLSQK